MKIHLVGGFLGSGKTTAITTAAKLYVNAGKKVGIITNDQGRYLVDTQFFQMEDFPAVEVAGGCFCCNYGNFSEKLDYLVKNINPDYIFAESVGSCTDLVATVIQPLLDLQQSNEKDVTFSVICDSRLLLKFLLGQELPFQDGILYIFEKQIEEAGVLVINKIDLLAEDHIKRIRILIQEKYNDKVIVNQNSLLANGIVDWMEVLNTGLLLPKSKLALDYQIYGEGEGLLSWFDGNYRIIFENDNVKHWLEEKIKTLRFALNERQIGIGHLKILIRDQYHHEKVSIVSIQDKIEISHIYREWKSPLEFSINARLECSPELITCLVKEIIFDQTAGNEIKIEILSENAFHPGFPKPTYRY